MRADAVVKRDVPAAELLAGLAIVIVEGWQSLLLNYQPSRSRFVVTRTIVGLTDDSGWRHVVAFCRVCGKPNLWCREVRVITPFTVKHSGR
jgi:hypothetical protein